MGHKPFRVGSGTFHSNLEPRNTTSRALVAQGSPGKHEKMLLPCVATSDNNSSQPELMDT